MNEAKFTPKTKRTCVLNLAMGEISLIDVNRLRDLIDELFKLPLRDVMVCCVIDEHHYLPLLIILLTYLHGTIFLFLLPL